MLIDCGLTEPLCYTVSVVQVTTCAREHWYLHCKLSFSIPKHFLCKARWWDFLIARWARVLLWHGYPAINWHPRTLRPAMLQQGG